MDSVIIMSLNSPRRDQRRRLLVAWNRSPADTAAAPADQAAAPAAVPVPPTAAALPGPVSLGGFLLLAAVALTPAVAAAVGAAWGPATGRRMFADAGRFAETLRMISAGLDPAGACLSDWIAQLSLCLAAAYALVVRGVQRARRDDYLGRYRAWGWLAGVWLAASLAGATPLGTIVSAALGDATEIRPGPGGSGWWMGIAATVLAASAAWAVLPMRERSTTAAWLGLTGLAWLAAAAGGWLTAAGTDGWEHQVLATRIAWWAGCSFALVSMLAASRSVIREARGLVAPRARRPKEGREKVRETAARPVKPAERAPSAPAREEVHAGRSSAAEPDEEDSRAGFASTSGPAATDPGIEAEDDDEELRHLSKAERKRLRKLRRQRAAA